VHVTQLFSFPSGDPAEFEGLTQEGLRRLEFLQAFNGEMAGYARLLASKPQSVAHALADSPAGQLAWSGQLLGGPRVSIVSWNDYPRGGRWASQDAPDLLLQDIRQFFRSLP
jgi:hypothetical protein